MKCNSITSIDIERWVFIFNNILGLNKHFFNQKNIVKYMIVNILIN